MCDFFTYEYAVKMTTDYYLLDVMWIDSPAVKSRRRADYFTKQSSGDALVIWQMSAVCERHVKFLCMFLFASFVTTGEHVN